MGDLECHFLTPVISQVALGMWFHLQILSDDPGPYRPLLSLNSAARVNIQSDVASHMAYDGRSCHLNGMVRL